MRRSMPRWRCAAVLAAAVICAGAPAFGSDDVTVLGRRESRSWLSLDPFHGSLELQSLYELDSTSSTGSSSTKSHSLSLQPTINLATRAAIIHPNFLTIDMAGTVGVDEESVSGSGTTSQQSMGLLYGYNVNAALLQTSDLPVVVYANRAESFVDRSYAGELREMTTQYGADLSWHSGTLPTTLRIYRTETSQTDTGGVDTFSQNQNNVDLHSDYHINSYQTLTLDYHYDQVQQSGEQSGNASNDTQQLSLTHVWDLDSEHRYNLTSTVNYVNQTGDFPYEQLHWDEMLTLRHTERFQTFYSYTLDQQNAAALAQQTHNVVAGFTHHLFESLTTRGSVGYQLQNQDAAGGYHAYLANLASTYTKKVPYGQLTADLSLGYRDQTNDGGTAPEQFINQSLSFTDPLPITIAQQNILPKSIIVRNAAGTRQYVEGIDYTVRSFQDHVEIDRVLGGNLSPDQSILVDYQTAPLPASTVGTTTFGFGLRYDVRDGPLAGVGVYGRYLQQNQSISEQTSANPLLAENLNDYTVGADYRIWKLTFNAEEEIHDSSLSPFNATRFIARYSDRFSNRTSLALSLTHSIVDYTGENANSSYTTASGELNYQITREIQAMVTAAGSYEEDSRYGPTTGLEQQAEIRWKHRQTEVFFLMRNTYLETSQAGNSTLLFQLGLRREF